MKILIYFGHPAQYLFLRESVRRLSKRGHKVTLLIKTKDVLETLIKKDGFDYINILQQERGSAKISIALSLLKRNLKILPIVLKTKPDLLISGDPSIAQLGRLLNIRRITITEDDYAVIKTLSKLANPFTETILCPVVCDVGKWGRKKIGYHGYMKLGYLHPNVFKPNNLFWKSMILKMRLY
jgi:predicted glycosyltransferase